MAGCSIEDLCGIVLMAVVTVACACWLHGESEEMGNATEEGVQ